MKIRWILPFLTLILAALACNWSEVAPPAAPVIEPSPLPTFAISTLTPTPTETPLPPPTSTPDAPIIWPKDLGVNCRYGPGKEWEVVSSLPADTRTEIKGRSVDAFWWYVSDPMNLDGFCWVSKDVVDTAGNLNFIPVVEPPTALVTTTTLDAAVTFTACGGDNQITLNGSIASNGPTKVIYHWELDGVVQEIIPDGTVAFTEARTREITLDMFLPDCGAYTVRLVVTSPNETSAEKIFKIQAP